VSLAATLLVAAALAVAAFWLGRSLPVAALAAALWLAFPPVQLWATRIKPDPLALALTALGLLAAIRWRMQAADRRQQTADRRSQAVTLVRAHAWLLAAATLFALAFFTKQTAVAAPLATGLALLLDALLAWRARRASPLEALRPALLFALAYGALIGLGWLALELGTRGQYTFHVWGLHRSEWWSAGLLAKFIALLAPSWPLMLAGAGLLVYALASRASAHPPLRLPACYLLVAPVTLLGAGETGANHNHLLEAQLALTLGGCAFASVLVTGALRGRRGGLAPLLAPLLALALLAQLWELRERPAWYGGEFDLEQTTARFVEFVRSQPGEVLADDVGVLVAAGRPLRYDDPSTMGPAIESGVWDESNLLQEVAARRFSAVLMPFDAERRDVDVTGRWSPRFIATLREHYRVLYRDSIVSYVPR
jgi:4-amino-4-deoxy-L-arabinose transferase-like glycosyltransferase